MNNENVDWLKGIHEYSKLIVTTVYNYELVYAEHIAFISDEYNGYSNWSVYTVSNKIWVTSVTRSCHYIYSTEPKNNVEYVLNYSPRRKICRKNKSKCLCMKEGKRETVRETERKRRKFEQI